MSQHGDAVGYGVGCGIFVGSMAHPAATWNKDHRHRADTRHKQRVVVGAADHDLVAQAEIAANCLDGRHQRWIACRWRVGIDRLDLPFDAA